MEKKKVVSNSSPLITLIKIEQIGLIEKLYKEIIIPDAVYKELVETNENKEGIDEFKKLIDQNVIKVKNIKNRNLVTALNKNIDKGESEAIALALEINADIILLDESDARNIADTFSLNKTGFIGILIKAKEKGYVNDARKLIELAMSKGFWINKSLYTKIIREL